MAYMSNQWLNRGYGLRNRSYSPVRVEISAKSPDDSWSIKKRIAVEVVARRDFGFYQTLHLSAREAAKLVKVLMRAGDEDLRSLLAVQLLRGLADKTFLTTLHADLNSRLRRRSRRRPT